MKQVFYHYSKWEDYHNGFFSFVEKAKEPELQKKAILVLSNKYVFQKTMSEVVVNWPLSSEYRLTNTSINRLAWLGQSACCYKYGVPSYLTKFAWFLLSDQERVVANNTARAFLHSWEKRYIEKKYLSIQLKLSL